MKHKEIHLNQIMTKSPVCVGPNDQLIKLKHIYEQQKFHHHILVTEGDKVVGIISLIDFMRAIGKAGLNDDDPVYQRSVKEIMSTNVLTLEEDQDLHSALNIFLKNEIHAIPVTKHGHIKGIITSADLLRFLAEKAGHT